MYAFTVARIHRLIFSRNPELRDLFLHELKVKIQSSQVAISTLRGKFEEYAAGKLPHARDAMVTLYDLLSGNEPPGPTALSAPGCKPSQTSSRPAGGGEPQDWENLKDAIMASLTTGVFIDCRFYAPVTSDQPRNPLNLQPLHFCSSINPGVVQKLNSGSILYVYLNHPPTEDDVTRTTATKPQA